MSYEDAYIQCPNAGRFLRSACLSRTSSRESRCALGGCSVGNEVRKSAGLRPLVDRRRPDGPSRAGEHRVRTVYTCEKCGEKSLNKFRKPDVKLVVSYPDGELCTLCAYQIAMAALTAAIEETDQPHKKRAWKDDLQRLGKIERKIITGRSQRVTSNIEPVQASEPGRN